MDVSRHAIERLESRFNLGAPDVTNILSILNNPKACVKLQNKKGSDHWKFKYRGAYMVAVVKDNTIVTFKYRESKYRQLQSEKDKRRFESMKKLSAEDTMTAKEVSEVLGVTPEAIKKHVRKLFPRAIANGKTTRLSKFQVTEIKRLMIPTTQVVAAKTDLDMINQAAEVMNWLTNKNNELQKENNFLKTEVKTLEPKAEFADTAIRDNTTNYSIRDAGKHLGLNQTQIFKLMREKGLLTSKNLPSQKALDYNVLSIRTNVCLDGKNKPQAVMTMENIFNLEQRYIKEAF